MKKLLVIGVIGLFLGLAIAPSINANVSKKSELVEVTTEICGLGGGKHTVQLTKEEAREVEQLIADIERRLDEVETREEAVEVFNEAVVELDKFGLLGELSVKQAQRLITESYQNIRIIKFLEWLYSRNQRNSEDTNLLCLITGKVEAFSVCFQHLIPSTIPLFLIWNYLRYWSNIFLSNIHVGVAIGAGSNVQVELGRWEKYSAKGWIQTNGLSGAKTWNGPCNSWKSTYFDFR